MTSRLLAALWLGLCTSSCLYDWTIGQPGEGGAGGPPVTGGGGQTSSGGGGQTSSSGGGGQTGSTGTTTTADRCEPLLADLASKKKAAKVCPMQGLFCKDLTGKDECGCDVSTVWDLASSETAAYLAAAEALTQAGCQPSCGACATGTPFCSPATGELLCFP